MTAQCKCLSVLLRSLVRLRRSHTVEAAFTRTRALRGTTGVVAPPWASPDEEVISSYIQQLSQQGLLQVAPNADAIARYTNEPSEPAHELLWAFDSRFYLLQNPDVAARGETPLAHFLKHGWREGRSPSPLIDMHRVKALRPNLGPTRDRAPLASFLESSAKGPVFSHPLFDAHYYASQLKNPPAGSGLQHFLAGLGRGARPHRLFIPAYYLSQKPNLEPAVSPLADYLTVGWRQGLKPHPAFDTPYYLSSYADVAAAGVEPLTHYVEYGQMEDRNPSFNFDSATYRQLTGFHKTPSLSPLEHRLIYNA